MDELTTNLIVAITGVLVGFISSLILARFNAQNALKRELKQAMATNRADSYFDLWRLCEKDFITPQERMERHRKLKTWYTNGGGLLLPFKATDHFFGALRLLEQKGEISDYDQQELYDHLTWLRTEMKYEVGSYSRKEANTVLPNTQKGKS